MKRTIFLGCCLLILGVIIAGCSSPAGTGQNDTSRQKPGIAGPADFSQVSYVDVFVIGKDWDSVPGNDGIVIYPDLKDANQQSVLWEGTPLAADIEIWSTVPGGDFKETFGEQVYNGTANITSWKDGKILMGGGIKVPFSSMNVTGKLATGMTFVTIHTTDGKVYTGYSGTTPLMP